MRSQARLWVGLIVTVAAISVSTDTHAFGRRKPLPDPVPSASPSPLPSPAPSPEPSPSPSPLPPLPIRLGQPAIGGPGCPIAATEVTVLEDLRTIIVNTSAFAPALAPGATLARSSCAVAIPIGSVPAGMRLTITQASATGHYSLARGATSKASLEAFFTGQMSDPAVLTTGSLDAPTQGGLDLLKENVAFGGCGADEIARLNASLLLAQPAHSNEASGAAFTALRLKLDLVPCDEQP